MSTGLPTDISKTLQQITELLRRGSFVEAANYASVARREFPVAPELIRLHGMALLRAGRRREAQIALHRAAELAPTNEELQCVLARLTLEDGNINAAITRLQSALQRSPGHVEVLNSLGTAFAAAGLTERARNAFSDAARSAPDHPSVRLNLATAELELGNVSAAEFHSREAVKLAPTFDSVHAMYAHMMYVQRRPLEAGNSLLEAAKHLPGDARHLFHAGLMFDEAGDIPAAADAFASALARNPDSIPAMGQLLFARRRLCDWFKLDEYSDTVLRHVTAGEPGIHPFAFIAEEADADQQLNCAAIFASLIDQQITPLRNHLDLKHQIPLPNTPIRIGFVSAAFNQNAIGSQIVALIEALSNTDLDVHVFATTPDDGGEIRRRLAASATLHETAKLEQKKVVQLIHSLDIEILIDLSGYSGSGIPELMAFRAAPVQIGWLGFPGSSGAPWMDYLIADHIVAPLFLREHLREKVVLLPRCFQPSDTKRTLPPAPTRADCGLTASGTVFACLGGLFAINPAVFARCMLILQQVPQSVLWLPAGANGTSERLRRAAEALDIASERLVFMPKLSRTDQLARYAHVDLLLDTLPWNAQNAAADALWAGCPILTRTGETFAGRIVTSLLHHMGLPELITEDGVSFIGMAVTLGNDREALKTLRAHLQTQRTKSPLFDMQGFADDFRRAMRTISARYRIGRPPIDIEL